MKDEQKNLKDIDSLTESTPSEQEQINSSNGTLISNEKKDLQPHTQPTPMSPKIPIDEPPIPIKVEPKPKPPHSTKISL